MRLQQMLLMNGRGNNLSFLDFLTIFSVGLQVSGYEQNLKQTSTDDLMRELQKQDRDYLERIIDNQKEIMKILSDLKSDTRH